MRARLLLAAASGAGAVFAITLLTFVWQWNESRPRSWNSAEVTSEFDVADVEGDARTLVLSYILHNHGDRDYRIDSTAGISLAGRRQEKGDLTFGTDSTIRLDTPVLVPSNERSRVTIHLSYSCPGINLEPDDTAENRKMNRSRVADCIGDEFSNLAGLVLYDPHERIRIDFPKPR